jgi:MFS family permease
MLALYRAGRQGDALRAYQAARIELGDELGLAHLRALRAGALDLGQARLEPRGGLVGAALGLATISEGFLYLMLQRRLSFSIGFFPLLYVGTALCYCVLAVPAGQLADRVGRGPVFVGGYTVLLGVYALLALPTGGHSALFGCLLLLGIYYAATDGVLAALASATLPFGLQASGLALLSTAIGLSRLMGSVLLGALWTWWGVRTSLFLFGTGLLATLVPAAVVLAWTEERVAHGRTAIS